jgi:TetR/AcrR family transcriptional regulator, copper-responsive repressor
MVQKSPEKRRGRPRAYDPERALAKATGAFWRAGYSATSLDDLSAATGMNRPSLYGAFGDKRALYLAALENYWAAGRAAMEEELAADVPLRQGLRAVYGRALAMYFSGQSSPRGCFLVGTAAVEAVNDAGVRDLLGASLRDFDGVYERRFRLAQRRGELPADADPAVLAQLASALMYALALRSRAGEPRAALEAFADGGVALLCRGAATS